LLIQKYTPTDCFFGDFSHWDSYNLSPPTIWYW